jgi:hypothetical protein
MPKQVPRRFLCVLQFYEGDRDAAESLASLIADLERTRNHDVDILLMRRADCRELSANIQAKLAAKFDRVLLHQCRRVGPTSYPYAPNEMWYDLVMLMAQTPPYRDFYYAFLNLETDVVPTRPGWLGELIAAWKVAFNEGKAALGHIETNPHHHLNGMAIYAADIYKRAGGNSLAGGSPQICYDIRKATIILPMAKDTPLIFFQYRTPTITPDALFAPRKEGILPALWHGVKDGSARAAVRARHISFTDKAPVALFVHEPKQVLEASNIGDTTSFAPESEIETLTQHISGGVFPSNMGDVIKPLGVAASIQAEEARVGTGVTVAPVVSSGSLGKIDVPEGVRLFGATGPAPEKRQNVYTYFSVRGRQSDESKAVIEAWRKGWTTRGWNPVVLTLRDAAKHPRFDEMADAVEKLPCVGDRHARAQSFYRWLALDGAGGGLMVESDVLPRDFTPDKISPDGGSVVLRAEQSGDVVGIWLSKPQSVEWLECLIRYDAQPTDLLSGKPHVDDRSIAKSAQMFALSWGRNPSIVQFDANAIGNERKSVAMERFLGEAAPEPTVQPAKRHTMADEPAQAFL